MASPEAFKDLRELILATLDQEKLVNIAKLIADADKRLLLFWEKKELLRFIRLRVRCIRGRESN